MNTYNSKILYLFLSLTTVFIFSVYTLDTKTTNNYEYKASFGETIALTKIDPIPLMPLISELNLNQQSLNIQKTLLTPITPAKNNYIKIEDKLNNYVINIFCTEYSSKYVKVASGSGVFLSDPEETYSVVLTNAHVARHLLDSKKKCVGRTESPTKTTHTLALRYIPYYWLNKNNQYVIGDPDQSSTGEYDFAIIESKRIKPIVKNTKDIYSVLKVKPKIKIDSYSDSSINNINIYSYPAKDVLTKNVNNPLYQKQDVVTISTVYASPTENINNSLLDVSGSKYVDHGSSGGMVVSQGSSNQILGISSVLIKNNYPQVVRVVTLKHVLSTIENDLKNINNAQTDSFLSIINSTLKEKEVELSAVQILKNIKLTSVLEQYTRDTLRNLNIIK